MVIAPCTERVAEYVNDDTVLVVPRKIELDLMENVVEQTVCWSTFTRDIAVRMVTIRRILRLLVLS